MRHNKLFATIFILLALSATAAAQTLSESCPVSSFGVHPVRPVDQTVSAQLEVTYFTTNDPSAFISEKAGLNRSASTVTLTTNEFTARMDKLESNGLASIQKRQSSTSYLGQMARLNLERDVNNRNTDARLFDASHASPDNINGLDRETQLSVYKAFGLYRMEVLSWFVDATAKGGAVRTVDYDADIYLKPGKTVIFKLTGDLEQKRSGSARSYMAVTMRAVNPVDGASIAKVLSVENQGR